VKKFYALALLTLSLAAHARAQGPDAPATRPRRVRPTQEQRPAPPSPQVPPLTITQPTPQPTPAAQTPSVPEDAHDYAPIREREISFKNWTFKTAAGESINLREWARGKRLVLVAYFAPWCRNSKLEAPVVADLYGKYHAEGFDVIVVEEYGTADEVRAFLAQHPLPSAPVVESTSQDSRSKTTHYAYRQQAGDTRKWGTPFNVFLDASTLSEHGDVLSQKVWAANGELVPAEAEAFIRRRLGLPAVARKED
jgi:thiol-disulfide isomerase/thioredoxin